MKARTFPGSLAAETCRAWLSAASGGRKPALVAEIVARLVAHEAMSAPLILQGGKGAPFRDAVAFPIVHGGTRHTWRSKDRNPRGTRHPDSALLLVRDRSGTLHPANLADADTTPSRVAQDIRSRLGKAMPSTRLVGSTDGWRLIALDAEGLRGSVRSKEETDFLSALTPLLAELLRDEPVRVPFDGSASWQREGGMILGLSMTTGRNGHSLYFGDSYEGFGDERNVRAGQSLGRLGGNQGVDGLAKSYVRLLSSVMRHHNDRRNQEAAAAYLGLLDGRVLEPMRERHSTSIPVYNWIAAGGDDKLMAVRRQAFEAYPFLVESLVTERPGILSCVDGEENFVDAVSAALQTTRRAVRSLQGVTGKAFDEGHGYAHVPRRMLELLEFLPHLPEGHLPSAGGPAPLGEQWRSLLSVAGSALIARFQDGNPLSYALGRKSMPHDLSFGPIIADLAEEAPFWLRKDGPAQAEAVRGGCWHVEDMKTEASAALLYPILHDLDHDGSIVAEGWSTLQRLVETKGSDGVSAMDLMFSRNRSSLELARMGIEYDRRSLRLADKVFEQSETVTWEAWSEARTYDTDAGPVTISPLVDSRSLIAEGKAMRHCVGTYVRSAAAGRCHIYSVTDGDGRRLSTIELVRNEDGTFRIGQNKGPRNAAAPRAARIAAEAWMADIGAGRLPVTPFVPPEDTRSAWFREIGYEPTDPTARDAALRAWGFILPASERGMTHREWAETLGIDRVMHDLVAGRNAKPAAA